MQSTARAPNRLLDLEEIADPEFSSRLERLDELVAGDDVSYLHPSKRWEYPWAMQRAELEPGNRVLDAGCGDSIFPVYLATLGCRVTALDLEFSADLGELHGVDVQYVRGDLSRLPLVSGSYDRVFCISVIEHLPEDRIPIAMQELGRVLRSGGRLLLTTDFYEDAEAEVWYEGAGREPFPVDWGLFDKERLERLILRAPGFELDGDLDLAADWTRIRPEMLEYHGYPYTSVGVSLVRR